jgi:hypothetical protein
MDVSDRHCEAVRLTPLDKSVRVFWLGERAGTCRDGDVFPALDMSEFRLDTHCATSRDANGGGDKLRVLVERQSRAVGHNCTDAESDGIFDCSEVGDVVELDAGWYRCLIRRGDESLEEDLSIPTGERRVAHEQHDGNVRFFGCP